MAVSPRICPRLAFHADRRHAADIADADHVCTAQRPAQWLERSRQVELCLTGAHLDCPRFVDYQTRLAAHRHPDPAAPSLLFVSSRLTLHPEPMWRGIAGRAAQPAGRRLVAGLAGAAVLGVTAAAMVGAALPGVVAEVPASPARTSSPSPRASAPLIVPDDGSAAPTLVATASPSAATTPTPIVTVTAPPATSAPTAAPQQTYVVQSGDTLAAIAQTFGVGLEALQAANGISDPDEIAVGTVLVIP